MAGLDSDALLEFFNSGVNGAEANDIDLFRKNVAANDPWRMAAAPVLGTQFAMDSWSPGSKFGVSLGQAFLGAALNKLGQQQEARQLQKVAKILPSLYANPGAIEAPEDVDPEAFAALKLSALNKRDRSSAAQNAALFKELLGVKLAGETAKAQAFGKVAGENEAYGLNVNPENPIEKKVTELRTDFNKQAAVQNFGYVQRLSNQLIETLKNPSAVADPILAKMAIQFVEPGLAVNAGEAAGLAASPSIPEAWKGMILQALKGESRLREDVRRGLIDIATAAYKAHGKAYQNVYSQFKKEAERFNIDPTRISALGEPISFSDFIGAPQAQGAAVSGQGNEALGEAVFGQGSGPIQSLQAIKQKLATDKSLSQADKLKLLEEARKLASSPMAGKVPLG